MKKRSRWTPARIERWKAGILWALGAAGIVNELFIVESPRPGAWPIIGALLALPLADSLDLKRRSSGDRGQEPKT